MSDPIRALAPCTCPSCGEDLEITCPNRCIYAHEGASGRAFVPARDTKPPRASRAGTYAMGSGPLILATLTAFPDATAREVAQRLALPIGRVSVMCSKLERTGKVTGTLPAHLTRGKRYRVVAP